MENDQIDLSDKHLVIGVPTYDGRVPVYWTQSWFELSRLALTYKFKTSLSYQAHGALMCNNRCISVAEFLEKPTATHFLFIDADILFDPKDIIKMLALSEIEGSEYDIITGPYPLKEDKPKFHVECAPDLEVSKHGLWPVTATGCGFMMIKRQVFERMNKHYPELRFVNKKLNHEMYALFLQMLSTSKEHGEPVLLGEDVSFCRRWIGMGGKMWCDPTIKLKHIGTKTYDFDFLEALKNEDN